MASVAVAALRSVANTSILITGGASGLGAATGRYLAAQGAKVTLLDMDEAKGAAVVADIGAASAQFVKADVTSEADVIAAVAAACDRFGTLSGAVNCAGIAPPAKVLGRKGPHSLDKFAKVVAINLVGSFNVSRIAAQAMSSAACAADGDERGVIINTASAAAYDGQIGQAAYAASKGGVVAMTLPMARELAEHRIRVNAIAPGIIATPMLAGLPQAAQDSLGQSVPFPPRLGSPDEFAALVHHVLCNRYINGEVIRLDGALRMAPK